MNREAGNQVANCGVQELMCGLFNHGHRGINVSKLDNSIDIAADAGEPEWPAWPRSMRPFVGSGHHALSLALPNGENGAGGLGEHETG